MKRVIDIPDGEYDFIKFLGANYTNYQTTELLYRAVRSSKTYEERPRGEWLIDYESQFFNPGRACSLCGKVVEFSENFCPKCGADMRGDTT